MKINTERAVYMLSVRVRLLSALVLFLISVAAPAFADSGVEARKQAIISRWESAKPTYTGAVFNVLPSVKAPYSTGELTDGYVNDGLKLFNFMRYLADIPDDVTISRDLAVQAQHGAVLLCALNELTHTPSKPADMDRTFYDIGYRSTTTSNLSGYFSSGSTLPQGSEFIQRAICDCMLDDG